MQVQSHEAHRSDNRNTRERSYRNAEEKKLHRTKERKYRTIVSGIDITVPIR
jgi:hypothetical protein